MDTQIDTAQRRAGALACEIHFLSIEHVTEHPRYCDEGYDGGCGGKDGECDVLKTAKIVKEALQQARREALEEAAKVARDRALRWKSHGGAKMASPYGHLTVEGECEVIASELDRLRERVEG